MLETLRSYSSPGPQPHAVTLFNKVFRWRQRWGGREENLAHHWPLSVYTCKLLFPRRCVQGLSKGWGPELTQQHLLAAQCCRICSGAGAAAQGAWYHLSDRPTACGCAPCILPWLLSGLWCQFLPWVLWSGSNTTTAIEPSKTSYSDLGRNEEGNNPDACAWNLWKTGCEISKIVVCYGCAESEERFLCSFCCKLALALLVMNDIKNLFCFSLMSSEIDSLLE